MTWRFIEEGEKSCGLKLKNVQFSGPVLYISDTKSLFQNFLSEDFSRTRKVVTRGGGNGLVVSIKNTLFTWIENKKQLFYSERIRTSSITGFQGNEAFV